MIMARKRNPFSLLKRGNIYYFRVWDDVLQKYTTARSTGETSKTTATIKASKMIEDGLVITKGQPPAINFIIDHISSRQASDKYKREGIQYLNKHVRKSSEFAKLKISEVQNKHLNRLVDFLREHEIPGRTINRIINYIKPALKAAYIRGYISKDPTIGKIDKAPENLKRRGSLTAEEINKIINMKSLDDCRYKPYIIIAILTSMRKGELRALQWKDIDFNLSLLNVHQSYTDENGITEPKTDDSIRTIPLFKPVIDALNELRRNSPYTEPYDFVIFQENRHVPFPSHFTDKAFAAVLDKIDIDANERKRRHLVPHSTRHSFVTLARTNGLPDFIIGAISGHTTSQMIDNYGRSTSQHLNIARDVFNAALSEIKENNDNIH